MLWCLTGQEIVFHCAAACPTNAAASNQVLMVAVNVDGSRNIIAACQRMGVPRLVYTSSASVVFEGRNLHGADERLPYASRPMDFYTGTKVGSVSMSVFLSSCPLMSSQPICLRPVHMSLAPEARCFQHPTVSSQPQVFHPSGMSRSAAAS